MLVLSSMHEKLFFALYNFLGPTSFVSGVTVFFAQWFPYLIIAAALVYEIFVRNEGEIVRAMMRIYTPPLLILSATELFKQFFPNPRPFAALDIPPSILVGDPFGSFPSSHTAFFAALGVTMYFCNPKLGKWFLVSAIIIGLARIGAGVHWPLDILGGFLIGASLAYCIEKVSFLLWKNRVPLC